MAFTKMTFDLLGEAQYARAFEMAASEARDLSEPLGEAGDVVLDAATDQFGTEGALIALEAAERRLRPVEAHGLWRRADPRRDW